MHYLDIVLAFIDHHPGPAYALVFLVSLSESLALVGLLVPGTVIMVGIGAIVATGRLGLAPVLTLAMIGAIAGDSLSYWLGHHYKENLVNIWPFSRYPGMLKKGESFFHRHGGKSIFFGRFVGPVRPIIPVVAGMLAMRPLHFSIVNLLSAVGWAFAYLLPGVVLGSSLALVGAVSTRLSILLVSLLLILWGAFWCCKKAFYWLGRLSPRGERFLLPLLSLSLGLAGWLFLGVLEDVLTLDPLVRADQSIYHFLQSLRTQWGDWLMVLVTEMGDGFMNLAIVLSVLPVLLIRKKVRAAVYWMTAAAGGIGLVQLFKYLLHTPRPITIYQGVSAWGFPSGHTTMSIVLFGFLAILLMRSFPQRWSWLPFAVAIAMSVLIAFSRLYLGTHWLSDVLGGWALGWSWATLLGIFYLRKQESLRLSSGRILTILTLTFLCAGSWHVWHNHGQDMERYNVRPQIQFTTFADWLKSDWKQLPTWRIDLAGEQEQPMTLQFAGDPELLVGELRQQGWIRADTLTIGSLLNFFLPAPAIQKLPLLPQLAGGYHEDFMLVLNENNQRVVLRLWQGNCRLDTGTRLWFGNVETQCARTTAGLLTLPHGEKDFTQARDLVEKALLKKFGLEYVDRALELGRAHNNWDGEVLLLWDRALSPAG